MEKSLIYFIRFIGEQSDMGLLKHMVKKGALGIKSWEGIYPYSKDNEALIFNYPSPTFVEYNFPILPEHQGTSYGNKSLCNNIILRMLNESCRCLEEGIIKSPMDGDIAAVYGLGFPPHLGGPFRYIDYITPHHLVSTLNEIVEVGEAVHFEPCQLLLDMSRDNKKFYNK